MEKETQSIISLTLVGVIAAVGQLLASNEKLTWQVVLGRAISTGVISLGAGSALVIFSPDVPFIGLLGIAAVLSSLGTSGLEFVVKRLYGGS